jgi:hypothetical protein
MPRIIELAPIACYAVCSVFEFSAMNKLARAPRLVRFGYYCCFWIECIHAISGASDRSKVARCGRHCWKCFGRCWLACSGGRCSIKRLTRLFGIGTKMLMLLKMYAMSSLCLRCCACYPICDVKPCRKRRNCTLSPNYCRVCSPLISLCSLLIALLDLYC